LDYDFLILLNVIAAFFYYSISDLVVNGLTYDQFYHLPEFLVSYSVRLVAKIWLTGSHF